ncbi:MAG: hypothetical protein JO257_23245 [Deltaproteobacteria bacterium]|nr:hypothetical protein [Deltaproteobacteria bacterium]
MGVALALAACGTTTDDRPRTIEYVTEALLAPTCGQAQCHSTFRQARGDVFDTVAAARRSLVVNGLISFDSPSYDPAMPANAQLIQWITQTDPLGLGIGRMPYDTPMPNEDVNFLELYIKEGAPGAQCNPDLNAGHTTCNNRAVYTCQDNWTFGDLVTECPNDCIQGACQ